MKNVNFAVFLLSILTFCAVQVEAETLDFESVPDSTEVGDFYGNSGIHFQDAVALTAGISLNEVDYPPHSGSVAVADDGQPISIFFDQPASQLSAWFAHSEQLTFTTFGLNGTLIGTYVDPVVSNLGSDELVSLNFSGVRSLQIRATDPSTYIMDDLSFSSTSIVPEPSGLLLVALFCPILFCRRFISKFAAGK